MKSEPALGVAELRPCQELNNTENNTKKLRILIDTLALLVNSASSSVQTACLDCPKRHFSDNKRASEGIFYE